MAWSERMVVNRAAVAQFFVRILILAIGFVAITLLVYAAGHWLVPYTDSADKAILAAINPDEYVPGLDQIVRAFTDYSNIWIVVPLITWMVAYLLYRLMPKFKPYFAGFIALTGVVFLVLAIMGRLWPNKTYMGCNVLFVLGLFIFFAYATYMFMRMDDDWMRRFSRVFWLVLLSVYLTDTVATAKLKDAVARPRPFNDANKPWNESVRKIPDEYLRGSNSFPSGHTSSTFGLITPVFWFVRSRKVRAGLFTWGCFQGFTRVYTAAHFPFCVFMGGVLGFTIGTMVFFLLYGPSLRRPVKEDSAVVAPAMPISAAA